MKFRYVCLLTFWCTLYISEKSTANVILEDDNPDIQPSDETSNAIIKEKFQIDTEEITAMRQEIFPPPANESSSAIIEETPNSDMSDMARKGKKPKSARNCLDLKKQGVKRSGIYSINPCDDTPAKAVKVYCDMTTDGGGFTVIQRRGNYAEQQDFYLTWIEYALGFGDVAKDFYLGNDNINCLTKQSYNEIRFDLADWDGDTKYAAYDFFYISDQSENYKLSFGKYSGSAGDALAQHNNMQFSTFDADHDDGTRNCAVEWKGGWWYKQCQHSNLNGLYNGTSYTGVHWCQWKCGYSLMNSEMKIRPKY